jgi:hypothetical protein
MCCYSSTPRKSVALVTNDADPRSNRRRSARSRSTARLLETALRYYGANRGEIDDWIERVPARFALNRDGVGRLVTALDPLIRVCPEVDAAISLGGEIWLQDPTGS